MPRPERSSGMGPEWSVSPVLLAPTASALRLAFNDSATRPAPIRRAADCAVSTPPARSSRDSSLTEVRIARCASARTWLTSPGSDVDFARALPRPHEKCRSGLPPKRAAPSSSRSRAPIGRASGRRSLTTPHDGSRSALRVKRIVSASSSSASGSSRMLPSGATPRRSNPNLRSDSSCFGRPDTVASISSGLCASASKKSLSEVGGFHRGESTSSIASRIVVLHESPAPISATSRLPSLHSSFDTPR